MCLASVSGKKTEDFKALQVCSVGVHSTAQLQYGKIIVNGHLHEDHEVALPKYVLCELNNWF